MGKNLIETIEQEIKEHWNFGLGFNVEKYEKLKWETFEKLTQADFDAVTYPLYDSIDKKDFKDNAEFFEAVFEFSFEVVYANLKEEDALDGYEN